MDKKEFCKDIDGNIIKVGDTVEYYDLVGCKGECKVGVVWIIGDMNEKQTNMPYIKGVGAWNSKAIRKIGDDQWYIHEFWFKSMFYNIEMEYKKIANRIKWEDMKFVGSHSKDNVKLINTRKTTRQEAFVLNGG